MNMYQKRARTLVTYFMQTDKKPRFHGNGFIQLYLSDSHRLHVWHPSFSPQRTEIQSIHNHRYDVKSEIFSGVLVHATYDVEKGDILYPEHDDVTVMRIVGASDPSSPEPTELYSGKLIKRDEYRMQPGSRYMFKRPYFHSSTPGIECDDPVVTIFEKFNQGKDWALALKPRNGEMPEHAFQDQPPENDLWLGIERAIIGTDSRFYNRIYEIIGAQK